MPKSRSTDRDLSQAASCSDGLLLSRSNQLDTHHHKTQNDCSKHRHRSSDKKLSRLTKRVYEMVSDDKQRKSLIDEPYQRSKVPCCGCPNNCGVELDDLRKNIKKLLGVLSQTNLDVPLPELDYYVPDREKLLFEAWTAVGASHLGDLISADLLSICARREKRDLRHPPIGRAAEELKLLESVPPFTSFKDTDCQSDMVCGITELWRRCMLELNELSDAQIRMVLSGSDEVGDIPLPDYQKYIISKRSSVTVNTSDQVPNGSHQRETMRVPVLAKLTHAADSTTSLNHAGDRTSVSSRRSPIDCCVERESHSPIRHPEQKLVSTRQQACSPRSSANSSRSPHSSHLTPSNGGCNKSPSSYLTQSAHVDRQTDIHQEIDELEMRARAIRSMLKASGTSKQPVP